MSLGRYTCFPDARWWVGALAALGLAVGACGGKSGDGDPHGKGTAGTEDATSGGKTTSTGGKAASTGGVTSSSGAIGNSTGATHGEGGDAPSSSGGSGAGQIGDGGGATPETGGAAPGGGGTAPTGGATPGGGGASSGIAGSEPQGSAGAAPTGGSGDGGNAEQPDVGTVGTECSQPGALQCAGTYQRVVVICGGDGTWEPLETCPVGQFCDTRPGTTLGSCQDPDPECAARQPGDKICQGNDVYACGPDTITTDLVTECEHYCSEGECVDDEPCPTGTNWVNCSEDCTPTERTCDLVDLMEGSLCARYLNQRNWSHTATIRIPAASETCACTNGRRLFILQDEAHEVALRLTVTEPWGLSDYQANAPCDPPVGGQCYVEPAAAATRVIMVSTDDPNAPPANVHIEVWSGTEEEACP